MTGDEREQAALSARGGAAATIARNALFLVAGQAITTALAVILSAALGRLLGASEFGVYYLVITMSTFAYVFVEWGQPILVIREVARDPARARELLGTALALRIAFALLVTAPAGLIAWSLGYASRTTWLSVALILALLPLFLAQGYGMVFRAHDRMGQDAVVSVVNKAITLGLTLPALWLGAGIPGVILAQAAAGLVALGVAVLLSQRLRLSPLRVSGVTARGLLAGGAPILAMTGAVSIQPYLDAIILSKLAPTVALGWFGAARSLIGTLIAPATILGAAAYPALARASADPATFRQKVAAGLRSMLWLGALAGAGTYVFAATVVGLVYGERGFGPAAAILQAFAPGFLLLFLDILLGNLIYASGGGNRFAIAKIVSVIVGTGLDVLLIPFFQKRDGNGGIGVVVAFALSELVVFAGAVTAVRRGTLSITSALEVARALGTAGITILAFQALPSLPLWVGVPVFVGIFGAASLALGLIGRREIEVFSALVSRRRLDPRPDNAQVR